jgi:MerR family redox-sensitive transcriptional activator SoxR
LYYVLAKAKPRRKSASAWKEIKQVFESLLNYRTPTVEDWQQMLDGRIAYLRKLRNHLAGSIGCGCLSMTRCPLYKPDDKLAESGTGPVLLDQAEQKARAQR